MKIKRIGQAGWRQTVAAMALMPLLAFCSSGPGATPATAAAQVQTISGPATIYINEVLAHTDEPQVDSVELYNPNAAPVDLTGWCLSDDADQRDKFCINEPTRIAAGGYLIYTARDFLFGLSEFGEKLYLSAPETTGLQQIDRVEFGVSPNGVSLGRYVTSTGAVTFPLQSKSTLGAANAGPLVPPVVISAIMPQPAQGPEYLLLTNRTQQPFALYDPAHPENHWQITGIGNNNGEYTLPAQVELQAGETIVITADPPAFAATYPAFNLRVFGPFPGKLNNDGERIVLQAPQPPETDNTVSYADMDVIEYGASAPWPAAGAKGKPLVRINLATYGDDPANWRAGAQALTLPPTMMLPLIAR